MTIKLMILIDDAIQLFHERHGEGIDRVFLKHQLTAAEKEKMLDVQQQPQVLVQQAVLIQ